METQYFSVIHLILINWENDQNVTPQPHMVCYLCVLYKGCL